MSNPVENNEPVADSKALVTTAPAQNESSGLSVSISVSSKQFVNILIACFGAAMTLGIFAGLHYLGSLFAPAVPFIFGGVLFATLVSAFFLLLRVQKTMRRTKRLRVSFGDAYTAVSIFVTMGFFAMACMHAFLADGHAVELWNQGLMAAGLGATGYGMGKFVGSLWNEGKN
jgi:hypothetical protein